MSATTDIQIADDVRGAHSLHPVVSSSLVGKQKWGRDVRPCWRCGFSPVRLEATRVNHGKEFAYTCPNEACEEVWKSPPMKLWKRSKTEAADAWDAANEKVQR